MTKRMTARITKHITAALNTYARTIRDAQQAEHPGHLPGSPEGVEIAMVYRAWGTLNPTSGTKTPTTTAQIVEVWEATPYEEWVRRALAA